MNLATLAARNLARNKFRTTLTMLGVAVAIVTFVLLRTVVSAWNVSVDNAAADRIGTRHRVSFVMTLPKRYIDTMRAVPGVRAATWASWWGGKDPRHPNDFFATMAVDPESYLEVYDEMEVSAEHRQAWFEDRQGALIGDVLARTLGLEVGDRITLTSPLSVQPSNTFTVRGIYTASRRSIDRSSFLFHWEYLNESLPESRKDEIGWMIARVGNAGQSAAIARRVDRIFENEDIQTLSMSEKALNLQFMAMFSAILGAMDIISIIILLILLMILGNTVAMGVRERTNEYGVLRALGFRPHHVAFFILGESVLVGILAGLLGIAFAFPVIELGMGRFLEENMGGMFPYFRIEPETYAAAIGFAALLGAVAAMIPALRASRLTIVDALRRTE